MCAGTIVLYLMCTGLEHIDLAHTHYAMYFVILQEIKLSIILLIKTTAAQNEVALSYHSMRGLYFLAVVFAATIVTIYCNI